MLLQKTRLNSCDFLCDKLPQIQDDGTGVGWASNPERVTKPLRGDMWETTVSVMGREDLIGDERYSTDESRGQRADGVVEIIESWTMERTKYDALQTLASAGVWWGAVLTPVQVLDNDHLKQRDMIVTVAVDRRGDHRMIGCPFKLEKRPGTVAKAHRYSEHTGQVLTQTLGVPESELSGLREQGVIL